MVTYVDMLSSGVLDITAAECNGTFVISIQ
nr:hypothetical protein [Tanacetum cinerariifolium]